MEKATASEKILHIRLKADLNRTAIEEIMRETELDGKVKRAAIRSKLVCFFIRLLISILNMTLGPLLIYGIISNIDHIEPIGLIFGGIIALFLLRWVIPGVGQFFAVWALLFLPQKRRDILEVAADFCDEWGFFPMDWNRMLILCAPYAANRIPVKEFKKAWKVFTAEEGKAPPEWMAEKLEQALKQVRQITACSRCGAQTETFRTTLPWQFNAGEAPAVLIECPQCKAVYCAKCRNEIALQKCPQCGRDLIAQAAYMHFEEYPRLSIGRKPDKSVSKDKKPVSIIANLGDDCKKLELRWNATLRLDAPCAWSTKGKAVGERPKDADVFPCVIHMENYGVKIGEKWYLAQALPSEDCMAEWEQTQAPAEEEKTDGVATTSADGSGKCWD
jgi:hypothetical protein